MAASNQDQLLSRDRKGSDTLSISEVLSNSHNHSSSLRHSGSHASLNLDDSASLGSSGYCNGSAKVISHSASASSSSELGDDEDPEDVGDDDGIEKKIRWFFKNVEREEAFKTASPRSTSLSHEEISADEQVKSTINSSEINQTHIH